MDIFNIDIIERILTSVVVAIITSFFSVRLALSKYKNERGWQKTVDCYSSLLGNLSNIIVYSDLILDVKFDDVQHCEAFIDKHKDLFNESISSIQTHVNISYLYLDKSSYSALQRVYGTLFRIESGTMDIDRLSVLREEAEKAISVISTDARNIIN